MKSMRYIKHRSYSRSPAEMVLGFHHNPLKAKISVQPSHSLTNKLLHNFKVPLDSKAATGEPFVFCSTPSTCFWSVYLGYSVTRQSKVGLHGVMICSFIVSQILLAQLLCGKNPVKLPLHQFAKWWQNHRFGRNYLLILPKRIIKSL